MHIVACLPGDVAEPWIALLRRALPEASVVLRRPLEPVDREAAQADYVIAAYRSDTLFDEQRAAKAVFTTSAGVGHVTSCANAPRHVPLIRVEDAGMAPQMVRYVLAAVLRFAQRFDLYAQQQRDARWQQHELREPPAIAVGILGLGVIGAAIARAVAAQDFATRGHARTRRSLDGVDCFAGPDGYAPFLTGLDVLVSVVPSTPESNGILGHDALSRLADGAHVVNVGRGNTLVEGDLLALLDSGKLAGATLDVFQAEPLPAEHPFWRHPRIAITPHVAGLTMPEPTVAQIVGKIRKLERGEAVTGVVDYQRGY